MARAQLEREAKAEEGTALSPSSRTPVCVPREGRTMSYVSLLKASLESEITKVKAEKWMVCMEMSRASPVAQMVKNLPAMQETHVQFLGQEDPLEKGMATCSSILA